LIFSLSRAQTRDLRVHRAKHSDKRERSTALARFASIVLLIAVDPEIPRLRAG